MKELLYSADTMAMKGPVCEGSTYEVYCDVWCASDGDATEDSLFEVDAEPGDTCAFCGKPLYKEPPDLVVEMHERLDHDILTHPGEQDETFEDEDEDDEGDGSGLHQCPYCYNLVNSEHEEFCKLNPNRNREVMP